jgi:ionotropic glutamate receptor
MALYDCCVFWLVDLNIFILIRLFLLVVSFALYLIARLSPYEWRNPHPCKKSHTELENQFTLFNSFWFLICNLMHQG